MTSRRYVIATNNPHNSILVEEMMYERPGTQPHPSVKNCLAAAQTNLNVPSPASRRTGEHQPCAGLLLLVDWSDAAAKKYAMAVMQQILQTSLDRPPAPVCQFLFWFGTAGWSQRGRDGIGRPGD